LFWLWHNNCPLTKWSVKTEKENSDGSKTVRVEYIIPKTEDYVKQIKKNVSDKLQAIMKGGHFSDDS
jgi:hypothetical protein